MYYLLVKRIQTALARNLALKRTAGRRNANVKKKTEGREKQNERANGNATTYVRRLHFPEFVVAFAREGICARPRSQCGLSGRVSTLTSRRYQGPHATSAADVVPPSSGDFALAALPPATAEIFLVLCLKKEKIKGTTYFL